MSTLFMYVFILTKISFGKFHFPFIFQVRLNFYEKSFSFYQFPFSYETALNVPNNIITL